MDKVPLYTDNLLFWASNLEHEDRNVAVTIYPALNGNGHVVSTVFLGLDHNFTGRGPPILFETMIFPLDSRQESYCMRYVTWQEAEEGHQRAMAMIPKLRSFDFIVETYAPIGHSSQYQERNVWARNIDDAQKVLMGESYSFGFKSIGPLIDHSLGPNPILYDESKDDNANLQL